MLINNSRILKNGDRIFRAPVIDSYLTNNNLGSNGMYMAISGGTSIYNPINVYYITPTGVIKQSRTTDASNHYFGFPSTLETSNKPYYFTGNIDGVYRLQFNNNNSYRYRGNLVNFMNEFINLETFDMYSESNFNQSLTNVKLPRKLKSLSLRDTSLSGNLTTVDDLSNLTYLRLFYGNYTGSISAIGFNDLLYLELQNLGSITGDVAVLKNANPNLYHWYLWNNNQMTGNVTNMDVSSIKYMQWYAANNTGIIGSVSGWTFNTGLTSMYIYMRNFGGDLTNWDISDTLLTTIQIQNSNWNQNYLGGDLSAWALPATLQVLYFYGASGLTSQPQDYSGCPNLVQVYFNYCYGLADNINDINFGNMRGSIIYSYTSMYGNLELFTPPTGVTSLQLRNGDFTGNLSGITFHSGLTQIYLDGNNLNGSVGDMTLSNNLTALHLGENQNVYLDLDATPINTNKLNYLYLNTISGITGDWSNLVIPISMYSLILYSTPIYSDISKLSISKITQLQANNCSLVSDVTNWFTGTTNTTTLIAYNNANLSANTTNWNVNNISTFQMYGTKLYGALKHNNIYQMYISSTDISSNIETDLNFSNNLYWFDGNNTDMVGNLSGVTLKNSFYYFSVMGNPTIYGTNEFIDYLFTNRVLWTRAGSYAYFSSIGDTASGATESSGSTGTWSGSIWNLTEAYVNNLAAGLDWDGNGSNTPWNPKQKVWWQKNAQISSTNTTKRYNLRNIQYS